MEVVEKMKLSDIQKENLGSILGVMLFLIIGFFINQFLMACFISLLAYMVVTQIQMRDYTKKKEQSNARKRLTLL